MNDEQLNRYSRHILLPQVDYLGQSQLIESHVLILGLGGLGSSAAMYLASSGVGTLTLCDFDVVETSNLQRQVIHGESTVGLSKVQSAKQFIGNLNSHVIVNTHDHEMTEQELAVLIQSADIVLDCTDNSKSRCLHNRLCVEHITPLISAAAIRFEGQLMVVDPRLDTRPCYQCVYPDAHDQEEHCSQSGILAPVVGMMGTHQALEAIKLITGVGESMAGKLIIFDALGSRWHQFNASRNLECSVCSKTKNKMS